MATAQAVKEPTPGFPPKGSLKRYPFARLLREIAGKRLSGSLYLLSAQTKKVVFFEEGQPVFVRSNVLSECLGQILAHEGLITAEQCEQTLEAIRRTGKKQGELLVEMGILSEGNLRYGLEAQLRAKLFDIFSWEDGRYQFKPDTPDVQFGIKLEMSAEGVIVEAIQDQYDDARARKMLKAALDKFPVVDEATVKDGAHLRLLPEERYFMACLDGSRPTREVLEAKGEDVTVPSPAALLFGLSQSGVVEMKDESQPERDKPAVPNLDESPDVDEDALRPGFEPTNVVTEYEDTPLPGELPKAPDLLGDHEDDFAGVEDSGVHPRPDAPAEIFEAEADGIDETFGDEEIELESQIEVIEEADLEEADFEDLGPALAEELDTDIPAPAPEPKAALSPISKRKSQVEAKADPAARTIPEPTAGVPRGATARRPTRTGKAKPAEPEPPPMMPSGVETLGSDDELNLDLAADDDLDLGDIDGDLALDDELDAVDLADLDNLGGNGRAAPARAAKGGGGTDDALLDFDDLDDVDLGGIDDLALGDEMDEIIESIDPVSVEPVSLDGDDVEEVEESAEVLGARRFNDAETALGQGRYDDAVSLLEEAYENGFDVAELHAMLAYARFMASGQDGATAKHAFELLDYAQNMDPSLDLVHAYRGAIFRATGQPDRARESLDRALELNPYCELAMEIMDSLG